MWGPWSKPQLKPSSSRATQKLFKTCTLANIYFLESLVRISLFIQDKFLSKCTEVIVGTFTTFTRYYITEGTLKDHKTVAEFIDP